MSVADNYINNLVKLIEQETNDMHALTALLHTALIITDDRATLSESAYRLFNKVHAHPHDCVTHKQAVLELRKLSTSIAARLNKLADCYEQHASKVGAL